MPHTRGVSPRWLLRMLPWVEASGGAYRVNRRRSYAVSPGRVGVIRSGTRFRVVPAELTELPPLRGLTDDDTLTALADRFEQREYGPGEVIVESGTPTDRLYLLAHGKATKLGTGEFGEPATLGVLAAGDHFGAQLLAGAGAPWTCTVRAATGCTVLTLGRQTIDRLRAESGPLSEQVRRYLSAPARRHNKQGEASIELLSGHAGQPAVPATFADYADQPREYQLGVAQTELRVHSRVADLYNDPMDQVREQLRLTIEALRERQEHELVNNPEFGLLHNAEPNQRIHTRAGPPTPDDLDELMCRRRKPRLFLAHPRTIAAFGRECTRRGVYPATVEVDGSRLQSWRTVPILPCDKIPVSANGVSSILVLRTGERDQGVVGLRETGIPDEYEPGLSVRFTGIDDKAIMTYLVSAYFSAAVLVPDALGVLDNVEITRARRGWP